MSPEAAALERVRAHCDHGIRYYTWALNRIPSVPEQEGLSEHVQSLRSGLADVLAYVEGATDERSAMSARDEVVVRYAKAVDEERWEPPSGIDTPSIA